MNPDLTKDYATATANDGKAITMSRFASQVRQLLYVNDIQLTFTGSNTFGSTKICSRLGLFELMILIIAPSQEA